MQLMASHAEFRRQQTPLARNFYTEGMEHCEYVEQRNGGFYVAGTRVSLDSIVYSFKAGDSPETIRQNFSSLSLEQVYGAIAFYLAHEGDVDANIREGEEQLQGSVPHLSESRPNCTPVLSVPATRSPRRIWRSIEYSFSGGQRPEEDHCRRDATPRAAYRFSNCSGSPSGRSRRRSGSAPRGITIQNSREPR